MRKPLHGIVIAVLAAGALTAAQDRGATIYRANCTACHGESGEANTPSGQALRATSFKSADALKKNDAELLAIAKKGKGNMPSWSDSLPDKDLQEVIAYIRTLQKKEQ